VVRPRGPRPRRLPVLGPFWSTGVGEWGTHNPPRAPTSVKASARSVYRKGKVNRSADHVGPARGRDGRAPRAPRRRPSREGSLRRCTTRSTAHRASSAFSSHPWGSDRALAPATSEWCLNGAFNPQTDP
jgi:hypothetical protein